MNGGPGPGRAVKQHTCPRFRAASNIGGCMAARRHGFVSRRPLSPQPRSVLRLRP
ncbi:hypothetical protein [Lysobacter gummosus]|uniref:hypothetical protein n=1 Tax=Lysobacter gummosus TaxID=262324 RepID=UPI003625E88E